MGWRRTILTVLATGLAVAVPVAASAGATAAGNRATARHEAVRLLGLVQLPPQAVALSTEPGGDRGALAHPDFAPATPNLVDAHRWWTVSGGGGEVLAYVKAHLPRGANWNGSASGNIAPGYQAESWALPPIAGVLSQRVLAVAVVQLSPKTVAVRTDGETVWIIPRPAGEVVPKGVREIDIRAPTAGASIVNPRMVATIVRWFDALPLAQPGTFSCPELGVRSVTVDFRARGGKLLARASVIGDNGTSGPCNPFSFSVRGHAQPPLIGGNFLKRVQRLVRVRF